MKNGFIWGREFNTSSLSALHSPKADMWAMFDTIKMGVKTKKGLRENIKISSDFQQGEATQLSKIANHRLHVWQQGSLSWRRWRRGDGCVLDSSVRCLMAAADKQVCGSFVCDADQTDGWVHAGTDIGMDRDSDSQASCSFINVTVCIDFCWFRSFEFKWMDY